MDLSALSLPVLLAIFIVAAVAIWLAGIKLSDTTDILSSRLGLGEALGGAIILAVVTNLPEIAITVSAALKGDLGIAIGNILGGIAIQTVVLVILDAFGLGKSGTLSFKAASIPLILEALSVVTILAVVVLGHQLPASLIYFHIPPASLLIVIIWMVSLWLVNKANKDLPWKEQGQAPDSQKEAKGHAKDKKDQQAKAKSTGKVTMLFLLCALVTLVAGVALEESGDAIAKEIHMGGVVFGATVLALATSLPEISTGLTSVKMGDYKMAMSDIFGGNAFLPVLFLIAALLSGKAPLPQAQNTDIYLTSLAILLTVIYICGMIFRPRKLFLNMGADSLLVLIIYLLGVGGLLVIAH
ncbi:sodium:calcium antiporter [Mucilaginibacter robiniae]|uniref:Sodium:calcium antiporter n=1 Tax=Mucilaginibacter robiniae TaxID=2728022 RepID=A0A7L5DWJ9_9SPHI|nr:sodium:calcium antiporter [Mucilaginibacter robiniae]QJD95462.1 sodium:calcium antiporter [Mucilaginibacter robiniae]